MPRMAYMVCSTFHMLSEELFSMQRIANYTSLLKVNGPLTLYFFAINYKLRVIFRMGYGLGRLIFITKISVVLGLGDGDSCYRFNMQRFLMR